MSLLLAGLAGANLIHDVGYVEYGSTSCFEQVVVMDEVAGEVRFILDGIRVDQDTLALEVIDRIGPGGEYVTSEHTLQHFRDGWFPTLVGDRNTHEAWVTKGKKTLGDRANEKVREILEHHVPKSLPDAVKAQIEALIDGAAKEAGVGPD